MNKAISGGCACGAIRYEVRAEPWDAGWCHCRTCQLSSGSVAMAFASVSPDEFVWTRGADKVKSFRSSSFGRREFCRDCGTPFLIIVDHQPETVDFSIATLDEPGAVAPGFHIFYGSKIAWFEPGDALPRHEKFRPNTRGLEGTEPPA